MKTMKGFISSILAVSILVTGLTLPVFAQRSRPVVITFGQPNIWSLEQAHYLLARMHRQNLDLQTATLGALDPNATNASRIDILKTLLSAGVSFDQAVALNNDLLKRDKVFNSDRRRELLNNRTTLQTESTQLARDIATLKISKASATDEKDQKQIQDSIDAKTEEKAAVDNQLTQTNDELKDLTSANGQFSSPSLPDTTTAPITGDLDALINKVELVSPSIAATLRLDNHIQMQYEIISKQLTLLRDEVGPGERLVFLELPQSINATQDNAENKMAQTWWRIAGYTTVNSQWVILSELQDLSRAITEIDQNIKKLEGPPIWAGENEHNRERLKEELALLCKKREERKAAKKAAEDRLAELNKPDRKPPATSAEREAACKDLLYDISELQKDIAGIEEVIKRTQQAILKIDDQEIRLNNERARLSQAFASLSAKYNKLRVEQIRNEVRTQQNTADRLLQGGGANTNEVVANTFNLLQQNYAFARSGYKGLNAAGVRAKCPTYVTVESDVNCEPREFVDLEDPAYVDADGIARLKRRSVRTVDIIPRQNAINVQDTKERVARTGIFAAVSFLFGFAGKFTYERQREQAEQFVNQELFTSGFGKGEKDFGWSFYPFAGTKQLASGVRTTYAVAIIPDNAETLVLKARGCYFPRKNNQPLDYDAAGSPDWVNDDHASKGMCNPTEQVFVLPVPGNTGDGADYYVTGIRYSPFQEPGSRMIASIYGQNLPSQLGVLVDGVPLREAVGLGQVNIEAVLGNENTRDNCVGPICGRFERIDAQEVLISFQLAPDYVGTPRIGLIGPGRSVEINKLNLAVNGQEDTQLASADKMFGSPPDETLRRITDFKVAPIGSPVTAMRGILTGSKFQPGDDIFVNGSKATKESCRKDLCIVRFDPQTTDYLTVTISPADASEDVVSKTFLNPKNLSIISAEIVSFEPGDATHKAVLTVKLDGSGFKESLNVSVEGKSDKPELTVASSGQMFLKIVDPEAVVKINVQDPANNRVVNAVVVRPDPPVKEKK